jgi:hypothetical protein
MTLAMRSRLTAVALLFVLSIAAAPVLAQSQNPQPQPQPQIMQPEVQPQVNAVCTRLEAQLAAVSSGGDTARAEQIQKYEAAAAQQQAQLDRLTAQSKKAGCDNTGFFSSMFGNQSPSCGPLNGQIQQMKGNLDRIQGDLARLQGSDVAPEREGQRRALLGALAQNDCGPQYRQAAAQPQRGNLFEALFGPNSVVGGATVQGENSPAGSGYRTVCVRMCDGYYYPISYSASPAKFPDDERACQASCPASEAQLFMHRNPGEDINQAVSQTGQLYTAIPNAFKYRQAFDQSCSCKGGAMQASRPGPDATLQGGDVAATDKPTQPRKLEIPPRPAKADASAEPETPEDNTPVKVTRDPNRPVRQVGPSFIQR